MKPVFISAIALSSLFISISACSDNSDNRQAPVSASSSRTIDNSLPGRWYSAEQVRQGEEVFKQYCARCHGSQAEGTRDWKKALPDGSYPPPPLNGSAHAWHHSLSVLRRSINNGGIPLGGTMPGFGSTLDSKQVDSAIAFFQSKWSDEIYDIWLQRGGLE